MRLPDKNVQAFVQHFIFHASLETWQLCLFGNVLGCVAHMKVLMTNMIGPHTRLWVFVKGVPGKVLGPFYPDGVPGMNLIRGALEAFPAQVYISSKKIWHLSRPFNLLVPMHL